ncbi:TetR/AcrR family transcriptional regulator [Flavobacterium selenitireducens]|uniref:TetR/AcrR family transcriptional regulator n=1 Tax=Flavobacterium selenitireducens TaxID=2722704 RepID=UPI00168BB123|nr:TetR/AcrR family transcriptional regulator [Flavobacterium selenitireducens]MBD3582865.1 TetR/AcrR family transcriptional regulator [Flavobacterium selenitireducens]
MSKPSSKAASTRLEILSKAFELIYKNGYQTTSVDVIIAETRVTKGAFYYHFKNKDEMGLALIREIMSPGMMDTIATPLQNSQNPTEDIYKVFESLLLTNPTITQESGCPAANLAHEMSAHVYFRSALHNLTKTLEHVIATTLESGKAIGKINPSVNSNEVAAFVMGSYWGARNLGKLEEGKKIYRAYLAQLRNYLRTLS